MIVDQTATRALPKYHHHLLASGDTVADLNTWAISLFSPEFSAAKPAFKDTEDGVHYWTGRDFNSLVVPVGWYIVLTPQAKITRISATDFAKLYDQDK